MNMIKFGDFYQLEFYNVSFFGRGWNPKEFRISGHYIVLLGVDLKEFVFFKHSDYGGLTWTQEIEIENVKWEDYEASFMNDYVLRYFHRTNYGYANGLDDLWDTIYGVRYPEYNEKWNTYHKYPFNNKVFTGLNPMEADILEIIAIDKDLSNQFKVGDITEFSMHCSDYWVTKVMTSSHLFKIVDRTKYDWGIDINKIVNKYPREKEIV